MKLLAGEMASILASRGQRPRVGVLVRFIVVLVVMVTAYAVIFKLLMAREGQDLSWITSFYWVLTVMSTLGFGDLVFSTDAGRLFSIVVLMSGMLFLLVLLPFIFIEFFYQPWMAAQTAARTPRALKPGTRGHVIITHLDAVAEDFIRRLERYGQSYALLVPEVEEALRLLDHGYSVVVGAFDDPETYRAIHAPDAALIAATGSDPINTLIASTVREVSEDVRLIATADDIASIDILALAGCQQVLNLTSMMGIALARRVTGGDHRSHVIDSVDRLQIAEASVSGTTLVGKRIRDSGVRQSTGVGIVGVWKRGEFVTPGPDDVLSEDTVLLLAGSREQLARYDEILGDREAPRSSVLILGGGRVGRIIAEALALRKIDYHVVERDPTRPKRDDRWVIGDAAELGVLKGAGIDEATTIIITTHDDDTNIYLTLYCRRLQPSAKILSRATDRRNVSSIHRAGADFVLSYASMGSSQLFNSLDIGAVTIVAEGLILFRVRVPKRLHGTRLRDSSIRLRTGATVVAIDDGEGEREVNPLADTALRDGSSLILIGHPDAESRFLAAFGNRA
ncbi:MAG: NAD-binding protein [Acidobacteriota bacterium]|nr:NAD-binding protein [Acidobacteriota bacterium]